MNTFKKLLFIAIACMSIVHINAAKRSAFKAGNGYTQKTPYSGIGKKSSVNGRCKVKGVNGYFKPSQGYKYVNSYARSK